MTAPREADGLAARYRPVAAGRLLAAGSGLRHDARSAAEAEIRRGTPGPTGPRRAQCGR